MGRARAILIVDSVGGLFAGALTFFLIDSVAGLYGWTLGFTRFVATANVAYGSFSGVLVLLLLVRGSVPRSLVLLLVAANIAWGLQCLVQVAVEHQSWDALGVGHLLAEGLYVGGLGYLEARFVLPFARPHAVVD